MCVVQTFKIYYRSNFQMSNIVLLTTVTALFITHGENSYIYFKYIKNRVVSLLKWKKETNLFLEEFPSELLFLSESHALWW